VSANSVVDLLPSQLRLAIMRLARRLRQEAGGDITLSQLSALATVERRGPVSLRELAEVERITPPSMTRISSCLEERGLVVRTVDAADKRVARISLTESGQTLLDGTRYRREAFLASRLAALSTEDRGALASALPILERLIQEQPE
jgi:DNA-binding MarR family transcriptional regulator